MTDLNLCRNHGNVGVYMNVHECSVMVAYKQAVSTFAAPYLDIHGEPDYRLAYCFLLFIFLFSASIETHLLYIDHRRGKPLFLCMERYNWLRKMVFSLDVPAYVAREIATEVHQGHAHDIQ